MTMFQIIVLGMVAGAAGWDAVQVLRGGRLTRIYLARLLVWSATAVAVAWPGVVQWVAVALGIGRGADVVLYGFVLVFLAGSFALYARIVRLEGQLTQLVRRLAIAEAEREPERSELP
jgi:hypothetical protein